MNIVTILAGRLVNMYFGRRLRHMQHIGADEMTLTSKKKKEDFHSLCV